MNSVIDNEDVFCPVCHQIPGNKIFQCLKGHIVCEACIKNMEICPRCRNSIQGENHSRNIFMEQALDGLEFDCPFLCDGCMTKKMRRDVLSDHRSSCKFGKRVSICTLLALKDCNFVATVKNLKDVVNHLETNHDKKHNLISYIGVPTQYKLEKVFDLDFANSGIAVCSHILQVENVNKGVNTKMLFVAKVKKGFLSWFLFNMNEEDSCENSLQAEISSEVPKRTWVIKVAHLLDANEHFSHPVIEVPIVELKQERKRAKLVTANDENNYNIDVKIVECC